MGRIIGGKQGRVRGSYSIQVQNIQCVHTCIAENVVFWLKLQTSHVDFVIPMIFGKFETLFSETHIEYLAPAQYKHRQAVTG